MQGEYHSRMSSGGLFSALSGCKRCDSREWAGLVWTSLSKIRAPTNRHLMEDFSFQAVYLGDGLADYHYYGFSNSDLWLLFHLSEIKFDEGNYLAYCQAKGHRRS